MYNRKVEKNKHMMSFFKRKLIEISFMCLSSYEVKKCGRTYPGDIRMSSNDETNKNFGVSIS